MNEKYDKERFRAKTSKPDERIFLALIAIANELAELNTRVWELKEEIGTPKQK